MRGWTWRDCALWLCGLLVVLGGASLLAACGPQPARATEGIGRIWTDAAFLNAPGDSVGVPVHWTPGAVQDGYGPVDGYATSGIRLTPTPVRDTTAQGWVTLPATARSDTVWLPMPARLTNGQTATGKACVSQRRQGQRGQAKCPSWTFTMTVPAPGPVDSAWTGPALTAVALGWLWEGQRSRPAWDEGLLLSGLLEVREGPQEVVGLRGLCIGRLATSGRIVTREVGSALGATFRGKCAEARAKVWPGRVTVTYETATAAERTEAASLRWVRYLVECGDAARCRQPKVTGGDAVGWRTVAHLAADVIQVVGVVSLAAPEAEAALPLEDPAVRVWLAMAGH